MQSPIIKKAIADFYGKIIYTKKYDSQDSILCRNWKLKLDKDRLVFLKVGILRKDDKGKNNDERLSLFLQKILIPILGKSNFSKKLNNNADHLLLTKNKKIGLIIKNKNYYLIFVVKKFIEGRSKYINANNLAKIINYLSKVHNEGKDIIKSSLSSLTNGNFNEVIPDYHKKISGKKIDLTSKEWVFVHGDFVPHNILIDKNNKIYIIDWENIGIGYAEYDLSNIIHSLSVKNRKYDSKIKIINLYEKYSGNKVNIKRLEKYLSYLNECEQRYACYKKAR